MTLTVFEQSDLRLSTGKGDADGLSSEGAGALVEVGERMGAEIASWVSPSRVRFQQFVGVVRVGDLQLEILPKLDGLPNPAEVRRSLLGMLAVTEDLEVHGSEVSGYLESSEPFICALARFYCRRLLEAVRRGLRQEYVVHSDLLPHVRGKIDWPSQAKSQARLRLEFACTFDERSEDTLLNRALKAALVRAGTLLTGNRDASLVTELRHAMSGVADVSPSGVQIQRLRTDRMSHRFRPLLALARLILGKRNPDLGGSTQAGDNYALVWDMNVLFEEYVGRLVRRVLAPRGFAVDLQDEGSAYLAIERRDQRNAFLLKPDILIRLGRKAQVVADTKWKRLRAQKLNLGVSGPDVYQVLAYANRYETDRAVLVYPHHPAVGVPGIQREFVTQGDGQRPVRVRVLTVDLGRLDSVEGQLEEGLLGDATVAEMIPEATSRQLEGDGATTVNGPRAMNS